MTSTAMADRTSIPLDCVGRCLVMKILSRSFHGFRRRQRCVPKRNVPESAHPAIRRDTLVDWIASRSSRRTAQAELYLVDTQRAGDSGQNNDRRHDLATLSSRQIGAVDSGDTAQDGLGHAPPRSQSSNESADFSLDSDLASGIEAIKRVRNQEFDISNPQRSVATATVASSRLKLAQLTDWTDEGIANC